MQPNKLNRSGVKLTAEDAAIFRRLRVIRQVPHHNEHMDIGRYVARVDAYMATLNT